jgi:hypothetical protein
MSGKKLDIIERISPVKLRVGSLVRSPRITVEVEIVNAKIKRKKPLKSFSVSSGFSLKEAMLDLSLDCSLDRTGYITAAFKLH